MQHEPKPRVLVTGMSGLIGSSLHEMRRDKYTWSALNRRAVPDVPTTQADIGDLAAIRPAFDGVDGVVHLAATVRIDAPWAEILHNNLIGAYNVFEAARQAGVKRVIFASSGATVSGIQVEEPYKAIAEGRYADAPDQWPMLTHEAMPRPVGLYGVSKVFGEVLARQFVDTSDLSILCLRIGWVTANDRPSALVSFANWCSRRDIVQMIDLCIQAPPSLRYDIFFVTSDNRWSYRDLEHAKQVLGFAPQDRAEDFRA